MVFLDMPRGQLRLPPDVNLVECSNPSTKSRQWQLSIYIGQVFWSWQSTAGSLQGQTNFKTKDWCSSTQCWQTQSKQEGCGKGNCQVLSNTFWRNWFYIVCVPELFMLVWRHQRKWMLCCMSLMWWLMPPGPLPMTSESSQRTRTWRYTL